MALRKSLACGLIALGGMALAAHAGATEIDFDRKPLPAIDYVSIFSNATNDYAAESPVRLKLKRSDSVDAIIRSGIEIRIFSLQPSAAAFEAGTVAATQPRSWATVAHCLVYLSLVFRPSPQHVREWHEIDLGPLSAAAGWLTVIDHNHLGPGYYRLVVEPVTQDDSPTFADAGGLGGRYEFIRLTDQTKDSYFNQGLFFVVSPPSGAQVPTNAGPDIISETNAFIDTAHNIGATLHCYTASPVEAAKSDMILADNQPCEPRTAQVGP